MFVEREELQRYLDAGMSLEAIGRKVGRHPTTVAYWVRKHGLRAVGRDRYSARGPLEREVLEPLVADGLTLREIAARVDRSVASVRHWLRRHGLQTREARWRADPSSKPATLLRDCPRHGRVEFVKSSAGHYGCPRCRSEAVTARRRRIKEILVAEFGGCCVLCGYDRSTAALHFHHLDPATKEFGLARGGLSRSLASARQEAEKCVLLCSNCHAEVEAAIVDLAERVPAIPG